MHHVTLLRIHMGAYFLANSLRSNARKYTGCVCSCARVREGSADVPWSDASSLCKEAGAACVIDCAPYMAGVIYLI